MLNKNVMKEQLPFIEDWLNERWAVAHMEEPPRPADLGYYNGAIKALEFLGFEWARNGDGKHIIF